MYVWYVLTCIAVSKKKKKRVLNDFGMFLITVYLFLFFSWQVRFVVMHPE